MPPRAVRPSQPDSRRAFLVAAALAGSAPLTSSAVGLVFVDGGDGRSLDEARVAFAGDRTWLQARSERASSRFAWVVALPAAPTSVETVPHNFFPELDRVTGVRFTMDFGGFEPVSSGCGASTTAVDAPPMVSEPLPPDGDFFGTPAHVDETATFGPGAVEALVARLRTGGWEVSAEVRQALDSQAAKGRSFLLTLQSAEGDTVDLAPVVVTHAQATSLVPLDFFVPSRSARGVISVTLLDARQVRPAGAQVVEIEPGLLVFDGSDPRTGTNWPTLLDAAIGDADGAAWLVESAGPANTILPQATGFEVRDLLKSGAYLTRFTTVASVIDAPGDATFEPLPAAEAVKDVSPERVVVSSEGARGLGPLLLPLLLVGLLRRLRNDRA